MPPPTKEKCGKGRSGADPERKGKKRKENDNEGSNNDEMGTAR
jgi:hypothetical protein